jgi:hypothetical protein
MTAAEARILQNQIEIMWTLHYLLECTKPDLVGCAGQLDRMRDDLRDASKTTNALVEASLVSPAHKDAE